QGLMKIADHAVAGLSSKVVPSAPKAAH
ncbi:MAG: hypothetical protein RLZZ356_1428, partial [Verrucomicrobiota bacterium]